MSWWNRRKKRKKSELENLCHLCGVNQMADTPATVRLKIENDRTVELSVCDECADFFDKSAEVLNDPQRKKPLDLGPYEEVD